MALSEILVPSRNRRLGYGPTRSTYKQCRPIEVYILNSSAQVLETPDGQLHCVPMLTVEHLE